MYKGHAKLNVEKKTSGLTCHHLLNCVELKLSLIVIAYNLSLYVKRLKDLPIEQPNTKNKHTDAVNGLNYYIK